MTNEQLIELAKTGDDVAYNQLFEKNEKLTHLIAHRWEYCKISYEELISLCWMGMLKAYHSFDATKGVKFTSYSSRCAENEIRMFLRKKRQYARFHCMSLEKVYNKMDGPEEAEVEIPDSVDQYENLANQQLLEDVRTFCQTLDYNKHVVFEDHIIGDKNQPETAAKLGVAQSWVSRIRKSVLKDIQKYLRKQKVI